MIVGFNVSFYLLYNQSLSVVDRSLGDRLLSIARAMVPEISSDVENDLSLGWLSLATISRLTQYFDQVSLTDDLYGIYLLDKDYRDLLSLGDAPTSGELLVSLHVANLSRAFLGEENVSALYQVEGRYFKSAFHPLGEDSVVSVLVVESSFKFFDDFGSLKRNMVLVNISAVAFLLLIATAVFWLNRRLIRAEKLIVSQAALSQMGQMAAVIAHEVRNPLAIIKATAERLRHQYARSERDDELLSYIPEEIERLNRITTGYLQFANPAAKGVQARVLREIVADVLGGISSVFKRKGVRLEGHVDDDVGCRRVDQVRMSQILINLLRNSLEATAAGGVVSVSVSRPKRGSVNVIRVEDTGSGLSKAQLKRIFDPFFTTKPQGSGLGLFVVQRLVREMNGKIEVDSKVGAGTSFVLLIPSEDNG
jgi:signal transduction histidine kinase